uniref:RING-type E3 ubiquitin transferase n=1 Tax=Suricata suricatta TaxID=37032 RepID=A0A673SNR6_SURSU
MGSRVGGTGGVIPAWTTKLPKAPSPRSIPNSRLSSLRALAGLSTSPHSSLSLCSYQHPQPPGHLEWGRRHSEPRVPLPGPWLRLTRRGSEPTYLPSVAVACSCWGTKPGLAGLAGKAEEVGGSSWKSLSPSSAEDNHSYSQEPQPKSDPVQELMAPLQSLDLELQQREQDSRDVVCGICMDKVWDKPEAERIFGILPNCTHAHCLGCLRAWRKSQQSFPLAVIKACPQCRVHSSYIIPHKFWVSKGAEKEQLIRSFKARTSQIRCRFFMQGNGRCPFKSDCIYLHQLPDKALTSDSPWTESAGPNRVPRGHRAGGRSILRGLCPGHGLLGFRTLTGYQ